MPYTVAIAGLTAQQDATLADIQPGDFILVWSYPKDGEPDTEDQNNDADDTGAQSDEDAVMDDADQDLADIDSGHVTDVDNEESEEPSADENEDQQSSVAESNKHSNNSESVNNLASGVDDAASTHIEQGDTFTAETNDQGMIGGISEVATSYSVPDDEESSSGEIESEGGESEDINGHAELYEVLEIIQAEDGTVTDIKLCQLDYTGAAPIPDEHSFILYGDAIFTKTRTGPPSDAFVSRLSQIASNTDSRDNLGVKLTPSGAEIRSVLFDNACPGDCDDGWLDDNAALQTIIGADQMRALPAFVPVCPVCCGKDLTDEQLTLRGMLHDNNFVDIGPVVEFLGRLNPVRQNLGYEFKQFDEREWGYSFEDMLSEDGDDGAGAGWAGAGFQAWDEAFDPNANPKTRPASEATLQGLGRKAYEEVKEKKEGAACLVCLDEFSEDSAVVELACGHVYDEECIVVWLGEHSNCPECRAVVSAPETEGEGDDEEDGVAGGAESEGGDDEDATMEDVSDL